MTPSQLSAIRARLDAATPGPWTIEEGGGEEECLVFVRTKRGRIVRTIWMNDAALIANAPTDLRALLDEVERLTAERDTAYQHTAEAFQRGVETFRRHFHAFALGATSYGRPSNEAQVILDELPRMQVDDPLEA